MATPAQIIEKAATKLALLGEGQTLGAANTEILSAASTEVYAVLQQLGLATWDESSNVPDQYTNAFATLIAESRLLDFPQPQERYQTIKLEAQESMSLIRELQARPKMGQTEIENF